VSDPGLTAARTVVADYVSSPRLHDSSIDQIAAQGEVKDQAEILDAGVLIPQGALTLTSVSARSTRSARVSSCSTSWTTGPALHSAGHYKTWPYGLKDRERLTGFVMSLPSRHVATMIQFHYLKDVDRDWTINDLHDLLALSSAIPYCDTVVTDKKA
jgi:hypothetical protein